jgi:multicomponent Na+:H+ antiporter subunit C
MTPNLTLVLVSSILVGTGVYLFLSRSMVRALMGFLLMGNGINLIFIIGSGDPGAPPIIGSSDEGAPMADPVPQALVLTAIVITLAMTAFVLALAHRSWQLGRQDLVDDDTESARIHARAEADDTGDDRSAQERAAEITAESELSERRYGIPGDPSTPTTEREEHAVGGPGEGTDDPQDVVDAGAGSTPAQTEPPPDGGERP